MNNKKAILILIIVLVLVGLVVICFRDRIIDMIQPHPVFLPDEMDLK